MSHVKLKTRKKIKNKAKYKGKAITKSSAKKRFSLTKTGKILATQSGHRHNLGRKKNTRTSLLAAKGKIILVTIGIIKKIKKCYNIRRKKK